MTKLWIPVLIVSLSMAPFLHAEMAASAPVTAAETAPKPGAAPTPEPQAPAELSTGAASKSAFSWPQIGWTALIVAVIIGVVIVIANQPKGSSSGGGSGSY